MNDYKAFYQGKELDIKSTSVYKAYRKALDLFKPLKSKKHMVHVHLCKKDNVSVIHIADF